MRNGGDLLIDPDGRVLDGPVDVARDALAEARALISDEALSGRIKLAQRIEVEDAGGTVVHRLNFWDAVAVDRYVTLDEPKASER